MVYKFVTLEGLTVILGYLQDLQVLASCHYISLWPQKLPDLW